MSPSSTAVVEELNVWPVKSVPALSSVSQLSFDPNGCFGDRAYMFVEGLDHTHKLYLPGQIATKGQFISQREDPALTQISSELIDGALHLSAPNLDSIVVPVADEHPGNLSEVSVFGWSGFGVDQGDYAAEWISEFLRRPARLVRQSESKPRTIKDGRHEGHMGFADGYPLLVASRASINRVNSWLVEAGKPEVLMDRFRPNIVLADVEAFEEDLMNSIVFKDGDKTFTIERTAACARCPIPDTDQITGERGRSVRSILGKKGRRGHKVGSQEKAIFFGQNFVVSASSLGSGGTISLDSELEVSWGPSNWLES